MAVGRPRETNENEAHMGGAVEYLDCISADG